MSRTEIAARTRVGAVIGWPVEHSLSPALHNAAFAAAGLDAVFVALPVRPGGVPAAIAGMAALGFLGASVTVPHKQAARAAATRLSTSAEAIGAVNCLTFQGEGEGDAVVGHNTDARGFVDAMAAALEDPAGMRAVLLGAGGAARAVRHGLLGAGAAEVRIIARRPEAVDWATPAMAPIRPWTDEVLADELGRCDLLVDCTSMGLSAQAEQAVPAPIPVDALQIGAIVATLVYHRPTQLLMQAADRGLRTLDGAGMLVYQGARAFTLWTGQDAPIDAMWRAMRAHTPKTR